MFVWFIGDIHRDESGKLEMLRLARDEPRAELHRFGPIAIARAISKVITILPPATILMRFARADAGQRILDEAGAS
jgi:hypothetical protein